MNKNYIRFENVTKKYGKTIANSNVSFSIEKNTIHAIMGENGSGKTTLVSMFAGVIKKDSGKIYINNKLVNIKSSNDAKKLGIAILRQHFGIILSFNVWQNIVLGNELAYFNVLKRKEIKNEVSKLIKRYGFSFQYNDKAANLSLSQQQQLALLRILFWKPDIIILDEPTSILSLKEINVFYSILRKLKREGKTILFITHKLNELLDLADNFTILRSGKHIQTLPLENMDKEHVQDLIVGAKLNKNYPKHYFKFTEEKKPVLEVKDLTVKSKLKNFVALKNVSLSIFKGEILAIGGAADNGQDELVDALIGLTKPKNGQIIYNDQDITNVSIKQRQKMGISSAPADRIGTGLVLNYSMVKNILMCNLVNEKYIKYSFLRRDKIKKDAIKIQKRFNVRGLETVDFTKLNTLSGGNLQKILIGRTLWNNPKLIIAFQPTWGIDVNAASIIYQELIKIANTGVAILLVSYDVDEIFEIADTVCVFYRGQFDKVHRVNELNYSLFGKLMAGESV